MNQSSKVSFRPAHWKSERSKSIYKVVISLIFGLVGFIVNFHTINFSFPPYTASVLIGLIFPMLITLTWGWKYGLISALFGGCQTMWWLWGPSNGYAIFIVVPPFTLWIVWHGIIADLRRKQTVHKWWLNPYVVEVPFRILSTLNLYTLSRWAITFNPPPWEWSLASSNTIPMHFSNFVVIKQFMIGYIILLLSDVLLNFQFVRKFFRLEDDYSQESTSHIISASLLLGFFFWFIDSVIGSLIFYPEISFLDLLALNVPPREFYIRTFFILACLVGGLLASKLLRRQRESDKALQESQKTLTQIIMGISLPVFVIDKKHCITHWNKACENLTGVPASEMIGTKKQWSPFYSVERPVLADLVLDELAEEEIVRNYSGKYQKSALMEGAYEAEDFFPGFGDKWLFFTAAPLKNHQGEVVGAIETLQDITDRMQAEGALRESEARYRLLVENANDSIFVMDSELHVTDINLIGEQIIGYSRDELIGRSFTELNILAPASLDLAIKNITSVLAGERISGDVYEFITKDGQHLLGEVSGAPIYQEGDLVGILAIARDVTERVRTEEALKEYSERLEEMVEERTEALREAQEELIQKEKLAVLGRLASGLAHELRNPLGVISNAIYFLETVLPNADETVREYLVLISEEVYSSKKIVSDLLDFSHTQLAAREETSISNLVAQVLERHAPPEHVKLNTDVAVDLPSVFVDPLQIRQVLDNLVVNAYQAMPEGGELTISAQVVKTSEVSNKLPKSEHVAISISDTGCGIPEENMDKLFEPLFTTKARGIGLGLAVSKNLVEVNGGSIEVESPSTGLRAGEEGKGSTFTVRLPIQ